MNIILALAQKNKKIWHFIFGVFNNNLVIKPNVFFFLPFSEYLGIF